MNWNKLYNDLKKAKDIIVVILLLPIYLVMLLFVSIYERYRSIPVCKKCDREMIETGYVKDGIQHYQCPVCSQKELRKQKVDRQTARQNYKKDHEID